MKRFLPIALLGLAMSTTGCAGGLRGDMAPGAAVAPPVVQAGPAPAPGAGTPAVGGTTAGAEGVTFVWKGEGGSVSLAGEFNGWNTSADPLKKQADGSWTLTRKLEPGRYMYKFVVDGTNWKEDPRRRSRPTTATAARTPSSSWAPAPLARRSGREARRRRGRHDGGRRGRDLRLEGRGRLGQPRRRVQRLEHLRRPDQEAGRRLLDRSTRKLAPGRYMYKFVVDGTNWKQDPTAKESADDGFGGKNSVVVVGAGAAPPLPPPRRPRRRERRGPAAGRVAPRSRPPTA